VSDDEDILREESNGHSIYGMSKWHRILECVGSLRAEFGLPDTAKFEAAEGTVAHDLGYQWLTRGEEPVELRGTTETLKLHTGTYEVPRSDVMFSHIHQYVEWVKATPGVQMYEQYGDISRLTPIPNQGGTMDAVAMRPGWLTGTDLKYGVADKIFAYQNPQVSGYVLTQIYEWDWLFDFEHVTIRIAQPRLDHWDVWHTTKGELLEFAEWVRGRFQQAWAPNAKRTPSEKACRYCKAKLTCQDNARLLDRIADQTFEDEAAGDGLPEVWREPAGKVVGLVPAKEIPTERLGNMLTYRTMFEKLFADGAEELKRRILHGEEHSNWFMAEGKNSRYVSNKLAVLSTLEALGIDRRKATKTQFASPAQLEELLIKEGLSKRDATAILKSYVTVVPGQDVLSMKKPGKRPARDLASESFEDETASENR
jgi:Protein of unknown function (DUF2800)